jgi:hypothetical protein
LTRDSLLSLCYRLYGMACDCDVRLTLLAPLDSTLGPSSVHVCCR